MGRERFDGDLALHCVMSGPQGAEAQVEAGSDFTCLLQELVTEHCFGDIWQRPGFSKRERSLPTLAMPTDRVRAHEVDIHTHGALANGVTAEALREQFLHVSLYCSIPVSVDCIRMAQPILT